MIDGGRVFINMIYEIADLRIQINNRYKYTTEFCKDYLSSDQTSPCDISVFATDEEIAEEKESSLNFPNAYIENICVYRNICRQLPVFNRFLLHAAILDYKGSGFAFLGPSGTGKSTHTSLWLKHVSDTKIVNGDKPIVRIENNTIIAYGTPWMGKEHRGENSKTVLKALCFLNQAFDNSIIKLEQSQIVNLLFNQILLPSDEENIVKTLELMDKMIKLLPVYLLKCNISEKAVQVAYEKMISIPYVCGGEKA